MLAGALTALLSPAAAYGVSGNIDDINWLSENSVIFRKQAAPAVIQPNNGSLILYIPDEINEVVTVEITLPAKPDEPPYEEKTFPDELTVPVMSQNISQYIEDLSVFASHDGYITNMTFTPNLGEIFINLDTAGQIRNSTYIDNHTLLYESRQPVNIKPVQNAEPQVLIIHTHATESFQPSSSGFYDSEYTARTIDSEKNIIAVGAKIAEEIAKHGFTVIHDGTLHDYPMFSGAYARSAETVKAILEEYPSIKIVLDVHRDAIEREGSPVAAVTQINGKEAAQIMIISAADDGNWDVPEFMQNFRFACYLQGRIESDSPGITRPVLFQYCNYNQHLSTGSLLLEIGSHGNTLEQALYTAELIGQSIGKALAELI